MIATVNTYSICYIFLIFLLRFALLKHCAYLTCHLYVRGYGSGLPLALYYNHEYILLGPSVQHTFVAPCKKKHTFVATGLLIKAVCITTMQRLGSYPLFEEKKLLSQAAKSPSTNPEIFQKGFSKLIFKIYHDYARGNRFST